MQLSEVIGKRYSLNHLDRVSIRSPKSLYDEAVVEVTLSYKSEGINKGHFTLKMPIVLPEKGKSRKSMSKNKGEG